MPESDNLINQKFGGWTVIEFAGKGKSGKAIWLCKCDCGKQKAVLENNLKRGKTRSCGCVRNKAVAEYLSKTRTTHGMTNTSFFDNWCKMKKRCLKTYDKAYKSYGGRGITVSDEWLKFENFKNDMYESYNDHIEKYGKKNTSLDRINNNKGYSKKNCRWATMKEQCNNRRNNVYLTYNDEILTFAEAAMKYNIAAGTLRNRINLSGWNVERALTEPIHKDRWHKTV